MVSLLGMLDLDLQVQGCYDTARRRINMARSVACFRGDGVIYVSLRFLLKTISVEQTSLQAA